MSERSLIINSLSRLGDDQLRLRILDVVPELRRDIKELAEIFREYVRLQRDKLGLDTHPAEIRLQPNKNKKRQGEKAPDLVGSGRVEGRLYDAVGYINGRKLRIVLRQPTPG